MSSIKTRLEELKTSTMLFGLFFLAAIAVAKTVLLTNDDGFASTNIRAAYRELKKAGHDVILVAPVLQRSSWGGKFDLPDSPTLNYDGEFGYVKAGDPSWGHEADDNRIWYFNGTPSSCVAFALDYVIPEHFGNVTVDLVVGGPNEGPNLSPGFYTVSGTMGAVYTGIYRGIPGISFSGSDFNNSFYKDSLNTAKDSPANIYAGKVVELVDKVLTSGGLPHGVGLNVNFPTVGTLNSKCSDPQWEITRMMGSGIFMQSLNFNSKSGLFDWNVTYYDGILDGCDVGDCGLSSEYEVYLKNDCRSTVSIFSIDYDASINNSNKVRKALDM
ncbi:5'/3'-nucleotidase sure [Suhomyces tanzawaensis NRRL Y-17324]|uniref:5'/3'-nucleotidase sure n=1 Tax=Suhomyces tanzawaensis NRRL Y-17324 TaxID=984487 RepID=A0A1E4SDA3_9ASCO|nr:5'/3'-nucleotidase sure [Suhomyces tanzawaensis NRRL Y-17324]ODV77494.1 5'/3'-nucleotidase sure [Suhomyces tanzawaensis NRRL Y-17324]